VAENLRASDNVRRLLDHHVGDFWRPLSLGATSDVFRCYGDVDFLSDRPRFLFGSALLCSDHPHTCVSSIERGKGVAPGIARLWRILPEDPLPSNSVCLVMPPLSRAASANYFREQPGKME
jgi:hypothetical protein